MSFAKRFLFRKRTLLFSFVLPYLMILLVPVLIGGVIYVQSLHVIKDEINRADEAILRQIQMSIDSRLRDIEQLTTTVGLDNRVVALMNATSELEATQRYANYGLIKEFANYMLANEFISRFFIFFKNSDLVLATNGTFSPDDYYRQYYGDYAIDSGQWRQFLGHYYPKKYSPLALKPTDSPAQQTIVYTKSLIPYSTANPDEYMGTIVVHLNRTIFQSVLNSVKWTDGKIFAIVNSDNQIVYATEQAAASGDIRYGALAEDRIVPVKLGTHSTFVSSVPSELADWKFVSIIPDSLFLYKAAVIRRSALFSLLLIVAMGGLLAYVFSRRNYGPIYRLLTFVSEKSGFTRDAKLGEFRFIEETVSSIVSEKQHIERLFKEQHTTLRDHFLIRLIRGKTGTGLSVRDVLDSYNIRFRAERFAVMLFYVEECREEESFTHFIIQNVVEDIVQDGYVTEVDRFMVCLTGVVQEDKAEQKRELAEKAERAVAFLAKRFGIVCSVSISRVCYRPDDIKHAYDEALEAIEYKLIVGSEAIIHYDDIAASSKQGMTHYDFSKAAEHQFANCLKSGDFKGAKQIVTDIIRSHSTNKQVPIHIVQCNMFALINTVIASFNSFSVVLDKHFLESLDPIVRLTACRTLPQLEREIGGILNEIEQYAERMETINNRELYDRIVAYTNEHYSDSNLSVSMIADRFNVSLPYLSKFFKQHAGEGLLEYIQKVRIHKAKELIAEDKLNMKEVALKVGYANRDTFIRLFKKYEGVTPGRFKS